MPQTYTGLTIQFTLARGRKRTWMNDLRQGLYPEHGPAHVTLFGSFTISRDRWSGLLDKLEEVTADLEPFVLEECGVYQCNDWVGIQFAQEDDGEEDHFNEIVNELEELVPKRAVDWPHITVYRGPSRGAHIEYFDEWLGTKAIRRRVAALVEDYSRRRGGNGLSVRVTGLEILRNGELVESFP
ncbi:hypothetical protein DFH07DRAFT_817035, partial [Mycena maculata]